jgi:hypothetical protein
VVKIATFAKPETVIDNDNQSKIKIMKKLLLAITTILCLSAFSQEAKEVIKIEVDSDCKDCISKRTYKDEIFTQQLTIVTGLYIKAKVGFAYQDNFMFEKKGKMIYFHFDQDLFKWYDTKTIYLNIDGTEYQLNVLVDFLKNQTINALAETVYVYSLGYVLDDSLAKAIQNAKIVKLELLNASSKQRKSWDLSSSTVTDLVKHYNCFFKYYSPIEKRLEEEKKLAEEEYQKNLKSYETDYRNSKWIDSKETVKKSSSDSLLLENTDALAYRVKLNNDEYKAFYYFNKDRLYQGVYVLDEEYVNENNFYAKYLEVKKVLTSKYGEPKKVIKHRSKDLWDKANEIGMAIQTGEYQEYTFWETKTTTIMLIIEGENFDSKLTIRYNTKDPNLSIDVKTEEKAKSTEGF